MAIIINFTKKASNQNTEDFRGLLKDLKDYFHFNWHVSDYKESNQQVTQNETEEENGN